MLLKDILPISYIENKFDKPITSDIYDLSRISELATNDPQALLQVGLCVWHQIVYRNLFNVNPRAMAKYIDNQNPMLYKAIEEHIKATILYDLYCMHLAVDDIQLDYNQCCEMCLAYTYPNDIVLADVTFINPYKPIPEEKRRYSCTHFEGLSLLPALMDRLKDYAKEHSIDKIILTAAHADLIPLFKKYGFVVDESEIAKFALRVKACIPMELVLQP